MKINRKKFLQSVGLGTLGVIVGCSGSTVSHDTETPDELKDAVIPKRKLGKNGLMASVLCLGAGSRFTGRSHIPDDEREEYLRYAKEKGVNYIDSARNYSGSERLLGEMLTDDDFDQLIVSSKTDSSTYDGVMSDFHTSMEELGRDYLDVYLLHNSGLRDSVEDNASAFSALLELREKGLIGNTGFSSHGAVSLSTAVKLVDEYDLDHLVLNVGDDLVDYRPVIPEILEKGCTVAAIKVTRSYEGKGPVESARLSYKDVLDRSFSSAVISHSNTGIGDRGWKKVLNENLVTAMRYG